MSIKIGSIRRNSGGGFTNPLLVPLTIDADNIPLLLNRISSGASNFIFFGFNGTRDWQIGYVTNRGVAGSFTFENTAGQVVFGIPQTLIASGSLLKMVDGQGTIGPAVAGTDYVTPSGLGAYLPLTAGAGKPLTGNLYVDALGIFTLPASVNGKILTLARSAGAYSFSLGVDGSSNFNVYDNDGTTSLCSIDNTTGNVSFLGSVTQSSVISSLVKADGSGKLIDAIAGVDYVAPSTNAFIDNQNAGAQASANAWIDGQYTASNASYITFLTAGQVSNVDISGGSASFAFLAQSAVVLGAYWVEVNGTMLFNNQVGARLAPSIPTDLARLQELQLPYGTWQNQTAAANLQVMQITSNAADSLYEVATSLNWRGGSAVVQLEVSFTSVDGTTQTKTLFPNGAATGVGGGNVITGLNSYNIFPTFSIWVKASTDITVTVVYVSGTPDYDVSAFVRYIFQVP